jgi:hypothetical protein
MKEAPESEGTSDQNNELRRTAMSLVLRTYFTITPGKYDEAAGIMRELMDLQAKRGNPRGRILTGHFVSPGQPNWLWESEFESLGQAEAYLNAFDEMPEMESLGPKTSGVWNQQGVEIYHVVALADSEGRQ